jgi:predicted anti-sigma-YlaC factor YlaD
MNCNQIRELLPDLAAGMNTSTPEVEKHLTTCNDCATHLRDFQKTMALLDEWQAPEPSPYFDTRMQARLREEMARSHAAWFSWLHRPAWGMSLAAVLVAGALGIGIGVNNQSILAPTETIATKPPSLGLPVQPGTAVGDLQALDRNDDLYADFDVLDQLQVQDDVTANP